MTLRCALVGTGHWAEFALLPALRAQAEVVIVACVGGTLEEGQHFAKEHAIPNAYRTLKEMLVQETLDVAIVAIPDHLHAEAVEALIKAGVAVFCEKPLSNDAPRAHELVALQQASDIPATVGYCPSSQYLEQKSG
jgi:predicted dehydrogenase